MAALRSPLRDFVSCLSQFQESVLIEAAIPKITVEALDKGIQRWIVWLHEVQRKLPLTCPEAHRLTGKLGTDIADKLGRQTLQKMSLTAAMEIRF